MNCNFRTSTVLENPSLFDVETQTMIEEVTKDKSSANDDSVDTKTDMKNLLAKLNRLNQTEQNFLLSAQNEVNPMKRGLLERYFYSQGDVIVIDDDE